jgi:hypothetical protein
MGSRGAAASGIALAFAFAGCSSPPTTPVSSSDCLRNCGGASSGGRSGGGTAAGTGATAGSSTGGLGNDGTTGSGGASSSGVGAGTGAGSSSGGSSGPGGTTGSSCAYPLTNDVFDYGLSTALVGAEVGIINAEGVPLAGQETTTASDGEFTLCPPQGVPITFTATDTSYLPTYTSEVNLVGADLFIEGYEGLPLISTTDYTAFQGIIGLVPGNAVVVAQVEPWNGNCSLTTGWTFSADFPDGGAMPDGGHLPFSVAYISENFPSSTLTSTTDAGSAILFNIDPNLTNVIVVTASNPDAPADCFEVPQVQNLTGRTLIGANVTSLFAWPLN